MKKNYIFIFLLIIGISLSNKAFLQNISDTTSVEYLMLQGKNAYTSGNIEKSNYYYEKVLKLNNNNFDAKFAIATNYFRLEEYKKSLQIYNSLLDVTPINTDVLNGIAKCYIKLEEYNDAMTFSKKSLAINNKQMDIYFDLAFLYIVKGKLDSATYFYKEVLNIDSSNADAYAGIGKMYYWQDKPVTAAKYYNKALQIDMSNTDNKNYLKLINDDLAYNVSLTFMKISEEESSYKISAFLQRYGVEKRIKDYFSLSLYTLWDYSNRDNLYFDDVKRWYDNTWIKPTFIFKSNRISLFAGASGNDSKITSYGFTWSTSFNLNKIKFRNYLTAAYDYFYYWNKVGQNFYQNTLGITYKRLSLWGTYRYAIIKDNYVWDITEKTDNPNTRYNIELKYEFFKNPKITLGVNQFNMNYKYASPLYYSPDNRTITGASISNYFKLKKFYTYEEFLYGQDSDAVEQTSGSIEFGYELNKMSFALNGNYFKNEFYKSSNFQFSIKRSF